MDKSVQKKRTQSKAIVNNIKSVRLPIDMYLKGLKRVLNINTVVEILSNYLETKD